MFKGSPEFTHAQADKVGVLLTNLGTPDAPEKSALRRYLKEFLWDPRVVEVPRPLWWVILNGAILNFRPARSAEAYKTVFTEEGSPLLVHSQRQGDAMKAALAQKGRDDVVVEVAMRYGNPSIKKGIQALMDAGVRRLLVLPLYPQYSASTTASTFDAVSADFRERRWIPELRFINHYHDFPLFIEAAATRIREHWRPDQNGAGRRL